MKSIGSTASEGVGTEVLTQVLDLLRYEGLPEPINVSLYNQHVLVRTEHLAAWCEALDIDVPDFLPGESDPDTLFATAKTPDFTIVANRRRAEAVA